MHAIISILIDKDDLDYRCTQNEDPGESIDQFQYSLAVWFARVLNEPSDIAFSRGVDRLNLNYLLHPSVSCCTHIFVVKFEYIGGNSKSKLPIFLFPHASHV